MEKTLDSDRHTALVALLKAKREECGLNQSQLADLLGEYQSFVARLESGQRRIDVIEFLALADALKFDPAKALRQIVLIKA